MERLLALSQRSAANAPEADFLTDSPRSLSLHLLRGLFSDARLRPDSLPVPRTEWHPLPSPGLGPTNYLFEALCTAVLPGFDSADWTVSNAALQLHGVCGCKCALFRSCRSVAVCFGFPSHLLNSVHDAICLQVPYCTVLRVRHPNDRPYRSWSSTSVIGPCLTCAAPVCWKLDARTGRRRG